MNHPFIGSPLYIAIVTLIMSVFLISYHRRMKDIHSGDSSSPAPTSLSVTISK